MAVYLKKFSTHAEYDSYINGGGVILPNVSLIVDNNTVYYNPSSPVPPTPSHDYVEIGGVKWATMNVGANSVTDYGLYFQWGDISGYTASQVGSDDGKKAFTWADYKYSNNGGSTAADMTKYTCSGSSGSGSGSGSEGDGLCELQSDDDAAIVNWGDSWRMPTTEEYAALGDAVTTAWTDSYQGSGVSGMVCTDNTDSSKVLFFPAAGCCLDGGVYGVGSIGSFWSSSLDTSNVVYGRLLSFGSGGVLWQDDSVRCYGFTVRPVLALSVVGCEYSPIVYQ